MNDFAHEDPQAEDPTDRWTKRHMEGLRLWAFLTETRTESEAQHLIETMDEEGLRAIVTQRLTAHQQQAKSDEEMSAWVHVEPT